METLNLNSPEAAAAQLFFTVLAIVVFIAFSSGWLRLLQQRAEVITLSLTGKLTFQNQAKLEKVAEMLSIENAFSAYNQGVLWNLIQTAEGYLKPLRRSVQD